MAAGNPFTCAWLVEQVPEVSLSVPSSLAHHVTSVQVTRELFAHVISVGISDSKPDKSILQCHKNLLVIQRGISDSWDWVKTKPLVPYLHLESEFSEWFSEGPPFWCDGQTWRQQFNTSTPIAKDSLLIPFKLQQSNYLLPLAWVDV